jgi:hypothetical protein
MEFVLPESPVSIFFFFANQPVSPINHEKIMLNSTVEHISSSIM